MCGFTGNWPRYRAAQFSRYIAHEEITWMMAKSKAKRRSWIVFAPLSVDIWLPLGGVFLLMAALLYLSLPRAPSKQHSNSQTFFSLFGVYLRQC